MATIDLGAARPASTGLLDALPRRLTLTLPELRLVAEHAGGAPLPFELSAQAPGTGLGDRLGATPAATAAEARAAALARLHDPQSSLARRGLLVDTALDEGLLGAVGLLSTPDLALDLDIRVAGARATAWHRQAGGAVATLATADGLVFELAWFPVDRWPAEVARAAALPDGTTTAPSGVPERLDLPYQLLDAAGEAIRSHRADLLSVLVAEHSGGHDTDLELVPVLTALVSETRGRLRAMVADVTGGRTAVVGVLSWVLLADGWRALRPRGTDRVEVLRVGTDDLAGQLAPLLAEARA